MLRDHLSKPRGIYGITIDVHKHLKIENLRNHKVTKRSSIGMITCYSVLVSAVC